tara:strand:+ start:133 stop:1158 length:1026 start_codon:yes stop_codon:yes gene_type:complete
MDIQEAINMRNPDDAEAYIYKGLKMNMLPQYFQTVKGIENPKNKGLNPNGMFDPYITNNNGKFQVNIGYKTLSSHKTLEDAKVSKKDVRPMHFNDVKRQTIEDYQKSEIEAKNIINKKYGKNTFQKLPIKSQFVIQDYIRSGNKNENFFEAIVKNDFEGAMKNYKRPDLGDGGELFRKVMFSEPIGKNDFANTKQAKNYAQKFIEKVNPEMSAEYNAQFDEGGVNDIQAEFTGNELINNKEGEMRDAMKKGNTDKAANIFRSQVKEKNITPGKASHKTNPLPVAKDGTVMNKNGKPTGQKAKSGAGIYDHIRSQYKPNMTNEEVIAMVQKNHAKWRKNNMD